MFPRIESAALQSNVDQDLRGRKKKSRKIPVIAVHGCAIVYRVSDRGIFNSTTTAIVIRLIHPLSSHRMGE